MQEKERKMSLVIDELRGQTSNQLADAQQLIRTRDTTAGELEIARNEIQRLQQENLILQTRYQKRYSILIQHKKVSLKFCF